MYGVTINGTHCTALNLILTNVNNPFPDVKTATVEIPGANGVLDLTEIFGQPKFTNRTLTMKFAGLRGYFNRYTDQSYAAWQLHGKKVPIIFDEDPNYFYLGRLSFEEWAQTGAAGDLTVSADCDPFKYEIITSADDWLWDPFNFEVGIIRGYGNLNVNGITYLNVVGCRMTVIPDFICSAPMSLVFKGIVYNLAAGKNTIYDIALEDGVYQMAFDGHGTVTVLFRGGML